MLGLLPAYWETWKGAVLSPEKFWARVRPDGSLWDALSFAWIASAISTLLSLPFQMATQNADQVREGVERMKDLPPAMREALMSMASFAEGGSQVVFALGGLLLFPVIFFLSAGLLHLFCMLFGMASNGFTATARVVGYASAPLVLSWVPCLAVGVLVYVIVLEVWGLGRLQQTTYGRATAAVLTPFALLLCCGCSFFFAAFAIFMNSMGR